MENDNKSEDFEDGYLIIAIDSTGIKVTNRGQLMRDKWNVKNKKGYLKIHIAVNIKNKKILSMRVTAYEHIHDCKSLPELIGNIIQSNKIIDKLLFTDDGPYEGNDIFRYISDNGIMPCIKVRKKAQVGWKKGHILRNLSVISQKNDLQRWEDS